MVILLCWIGFCSVLFCSVVDTGDDGENDGVSCAPVGFLGCFFLCVQVNCRHYHEYGTGCLDRFDKEQKIVKFTQYTSMVAVPISMILPRPVQEAVQYSGFWGEDQKENIIMLPTLRVLNVLYRVFHVDGTWRPI